jgi:hypothetical protein
MEMKVFFILIAIFCPCVWAASETSAKSPKPSADNIIYEEVKINYKYREGEYLVYDCQDKYFVCVHEEDFKECEKKRADDIRRERAWMRCAPFKGFKDEKACQKLLYKKLHKPRQEGSWCRRKSN